eukprot:CAMPEP_0184296284 /NCGR_PEP_ID=MMETSP1049-20130417/7270_1 /TAXON_ID=77928 /ORGANISM="Proteomonas sulcata, Strain CCMP704" /LENGTH=156 /DNA_ID=CAMNT_0026605437 /DNA_START=41 /DNA_END=511 /DNA_ORIENTATION=+
MGEINAYSTEKMALLPVGDQLPDFLDVVRAACQPHFNAHFEAQLFFAQSKAGAVQATMIQPRCTSNTDSDPTSMSPSGGLGSDPQNLGSTSWNSLSGTATTTSPVIHQPPLGTPAIGDHSDPDGSHRRYDRHCERRNQKRKDRLDDYRDHDRRERR